MCDIPLFEYQRFANAKKSVIPTLTANAANAGMGYALASSCAVANSASTTGGST